eukprot:7854874-Pyramimonas_sp.AAC.1
MRSGTVGCPMRPWISGSVRPTGTFRGSSTLGPPLGVPFAPCGPHSGAWVSLLLRPRPGSGLMGPTSTRWTTAPS